MNNETPFVIVSAYRAGYHPDTNKARHKELAGLIGDFGLTPVEVRGCWHGTNEQAVLVFLPEGDAGDDYDNIRAMARAFNQDSIFYVDASRYAYLDWLDWNDTEELGKWSPVPSDGPLPGSYTVTPDGRKWYAERESYPSEVAKVA